ncbi:NifB/NifX family molybdenum-iron cluster-binding protein [Treponema sp. C6A8]|uniref:NifB/NifX family molybdenum-iron cluster-binding protein n=1 Tax=Treponema sp. C6A8 TaxID=1410609 RepID=UPI000483B9A9|nr:NifB/NifX family molybdenum-iron cluster-binding protein [Treponema sp. C6A8]
MEYKIAVASSDGVNVDLHFGAAESFLIFAVSDDGTFELKEKREYKEVSELQAADCAEKANCKSGCGNGNGNGCGGGSAKVEVIGDVRAVVAAKIGFNVTKQLERKAIASFDVETTVQEALEKITKYFYSVDNHISLVNRR